ncbi:MAG: hypothetical protein IPI39_25390 [Candidatus Obscuribacter sp.]|nr:hypothetical protein [Candidatus Obscuribacter sp.]
MKLTGAALGFAPGTRTNSGYERWWEARKLWGGIVNQSRNFVVLYLNHGPDDKSMALPNGSWTNHFLPAQLRHNLRSEKPGIELVDLKLVKADKKRC